MRIYRRNKFRKKPERRGGQRFAASLRACKKRNKSEEKSKEKPGKEAGKAVTFPVRAPDGHLSLDSTNRLAAVAKGG